MHLDAKIEALRSTFDPPDKSELPIYVVKPGESLFRIARHVLRDADRRDEIFALNRDLIDDPDDIFPGDPLRMPKDAAILSEEVRRAPDDQVRASDLGQAA
nr:LysM peptidoglycan-binding domain-containing protein [Qipengyuania aestuarii]